MKRILFVGALVLVLAGPAAAQQVLKNGTISTSGADCSTATACVVLEERQLQGVEQVGIYVNVGTSGTFHFEAEGEDGVWFAIANTAGNSSVTADGNYYIVNQGVQRIRVRASAISGNATVTMSRGFVAAAAASISGADGAIQDGSNSAIEATVFDYTNANPLAAIIVDTNGTPASIGGGTQYTEADTDATITGNAILFESNTGTNALSVVSNSAPLPISDAGGSLTVDGTVAVVGPEAIDAAIGTNPIVGAGRASTALPSAVSADNDSQAVWLTRNGAVNTTPRDVNGDAVTDATANAVKILAVDSTGATISDVADGAASSGNPVAVGGLVESSLAGITALDDADRSTLSTDTDRALYVRTYGSMGDIVQERTTNTDGASTAFASGLAAPGAGVKIYLSACSLSNTSASAITVDIRDGAAGSVLWTLSVPAGSGNNFTWDVPLKFTANTAVAFDASAATTTLSIACNGFKSKL
jgi:hypothetical protein